MGVKEKPIIFVYGPTAVGKTDFADTLAAQVGGEIINMDSAQSYVPLTIGTAKPDWNNAPVLHHLFDTISTPEHSSVTEYRKQALEAIKKIRKKGKVPIFVGGSGFYLMSLFYPPTGDQPPASDSKGTWEELYAIDPQRAQEVHKNDQYRIDRALAIWRETGIKPSEYVPAFDPPGNALILFLTRNTSELKERIYQRTNQMLDHGFVQEVEGLDVAWRDFLRKKNIIGYGEVLDYLESDQTQADFDTMKETIFYKTCQYAKRQRTFWRMLEKKLAQEEDSSTSLDCRVINLTLTRLDLYIKQLLKSIDSI